MKCFLLLVVLSPAFPLVTVAQRSKLSCYRIQRCLNGQQFTAASIIRLAQQRKLSLDDDIRKCVPEIPDYGTPITIRHLTYHAKREIHA